jgi:hypothetical protein
VGVSRAFGIYPLLAEMAKRNNAVRKVDNLEANAAGKTTVMIAAYVVLLPVLIRSHASRVRRALQPGAKRCHRWGL